MLGTVERIKALLLAWRVVQLKKGIKPKITDAESGTLTRGNGFKAAQ